MADVETELDTRVHRLIDNSNDDLRPAVAEVLQRHGYGIEATKGRPYSNPFGHPLVDLPLWVDASLQDRSGISDEALMDIIESSLVGYLHVRLQDDYIDEAIGSPESAMLGSTLFLTRHLSLLARWVEISDFWDRFETIWHRYAEAMLLESKLHERGRDYGADEFDKVLDRSQPLEIPGAAVLALGGEWNRIDRLTRLVRSLTRATQLFGDLMDAPGDLAAGNLTYVVRRLGGESGIAELRRGLATGFDRVLDEALDAVAGGASEAESMGLNGAIQYLATKREAMEEARRTFASHLMTQLLESS